MRLLKKDEHGLRFPRLYTLFLCSNYFPFATEGKMLFMIGGVVGKSWNLQQFRKYCKTIQFKPEQVFENWWLYHDLLYLKISTYIMETYNWNNITYFTTYINKTFSQNHTKYIQEIKVSNSLITLILVCLTKQIKLVPEIHINANLENYSHLIIILASTTS